MGTLENDAAGNWAYLKMMAWWKPGKLEIGHSETGVLLTGMPETLGTGYWRPGMLELQTLEI